MSSTEELSGNPWDDLYFTPDHPDADRWRAEIAAELAAGFPDEPQGTPDNSHFSAWSTDKTITN